MRAGYPASGSDLADYLTFCNLLAEANIDLAQVGEQGDHALSMFDINQVTTEKEITQFDDRAGTGCAHGCTLISGDIHTAMWSTFLPIEDPAPAKTAGADTLNGEQKINIYVNH